MITIDNREAVFDTLIAISDTSIYISYEGDTLDKYLAELAPVKNDDDARRIIGGGTCIKFCNIIKIIQVF